MIEIIPAVDVLDGKVVRLLHGDYEQVTVYADDPAVQARGWVEQGAALVHVVDLLGAKTGTPDRSLWRTLARAGVPFQVGGGIRSAETARQALEEGARRVVMGTAAVWAPDLLAEVGDATRVVAAVDVRDGRATGAGWLDEGRELGDVLDGLAGAGIERMLVTGISRDGTMDGPEADLMRRVVDDGRFAVIASGGVGVLEDVRAMASIGCEAVVIGRALYEGRFSVADAIAAT